MTSPVLSAREMEGNLRNLLEPAALAGGRMRMDDETRT